MRTRKTHYDNVVRPSVGVFPAHCGTDADAKHRTQEFSLVSCERCLHLLRVAAVRPFALALRASGQAKVVAELISEGFTEHGNPFDVPGRPHEWARAVEYALRG